MNIAAIIVGIDGWENYTLPLVESLHRHELDCRVVVVDNQSSPPYPYYADSAIAPWNSIVRTERLCYSAAINRGKRMAGDADWYIVLSNDVLCTGPFAHILEAWGDDVILGPRLMENMGYRYLEGWCVAIPHRVWDAIGGWDENFRMASWEDVDIAYSAAEAGFSLAHVVDFPFVHLDQRQRHGMDEFWSADLHNFRYFTEKRERRAAGQVGWKRFPERVSA